MAANLDMIVDTVDAHNRVVGRSQRRQLFEQHQNFRTVHVLLFTDNEKLVLQKLPANHLRSPERLGSTVAGYLHTNENYFEAARRKMKDEIGITTTIKSVGTFEMSDKGCRKFIGVYTGKLRKEPDIDPQQIAGLVFLSSKELDLEVKQSPSKFTETFLFVYKQMKSRS